MMSSTDNTNQLAKQGRSLTISLPCPPCPSPLSFPLSSPRLLPPDHSVVRSALPDSPFDRSTIIRHASRHSGNLQVYSSPQAGHDVLRHSQQGDPTHLQKVHAECTSALVHNSFTIVSFHQYADPLHVVPYSLSRSTSTTRRSSPCTDSSSTLFD